MIYHDLSWFIRGKLGLLRNGSFKSSKVLLTVCAIDGWSALLDRWKKAIGASANSLPHVPLPDICFDRFMTCCFDVSFVECFSFSQHSFIYFSMWKKFSAKRDLHRTIKAWIEGTKRAETSWGWRWKKALTKQVVNDVNGYWQRESEY